MALRAAEVPWDCMAFGFRVAQIYDLSVAEPRKAALEFREFQEWLDAGLVRLVSCRLPHERLRESMFLEDRGFRFVEMVLHPSLGVLQELEIPADDLKIAPASAADLAELQDIAGRSFKHERYHVDPRLDPQLADRRYSNWVGSSLGSEKQKLLKVEHGEKLVAVFITESWPPHDVYWHLTAISPEFQGQGYGRRAWRAMLKSHQLAGCERVLTTVSARNTAVINLYGQLGFRFLPPEMSFHWLRGST